MVVNYEPILRSEKTRWLLLFLPETIVVQIVGRCMGRGIVQALPAEGRKVFSCLLAIESGGSFTSHLNVHNAMDGSSDSNITAKVQDKQEQKMPLGFINKERLSNGTKQEWTRKITVPASPDQYCPRLLPPWPLKPVISNHHGPRSIIRLSSLRGPLCRPKRPPDEPILQPFLENQV